ncbi:MAG: hypothetical protein HKM89_04980 [Gemmatimonadales bacterium]|nr:hypothetical protein [Gemmatimonadales bacterium]
MAKSEPQTFATHARLVPGYHFITFGLLVINLGWSIYRLVKVPGWDTAVTLGVAIALGFLFFYARSFPLAVQDRLIRLEERLRMATLLPADLKPRIGDFTPAQLIALRFASDNELPTLARRVLDQGLTDRATIKRLITEWRADHVRA